MEEEKGDGGVEGEALFDRLNVVLATFLVFSFSLLLLFFFPPLLFIIVTNIFAMLSQAYELTNQTPTSLERLYIQFPGK